MRKLVVTSKFKRALKKFVNRNASLQQQVEKTLLQMTEDIFAPNLMSHRLKGEYEGLRACSCGYDCRIIFSIEKNKETNEEALVPCYGKKLCNPFGIWISTI
ncbi:MAG: type II toxin-antitoxin system YafQ family toxin [Pseudanabaena sp.]